MKKSGLDYLPAETFQAWKTARETFDPERNKLSARALGLDPQVFRPITFLTHSLIQPDIAQWFAAVLLLLVAGMALELALGSGAVLAGFLGGGLIGALAFLIGNGNNVLPLSGAGSGAAGILGMLVMHFHREPVLYFKRKQGRIFWIIPLWIALLAMQFFLSPLHITALAAQIAAFASGPLWWLIYQKWFMSDEVVELHIEEELVTDQDLVYREKLHLALEAIGRLEFTEGKKMLRELYKEHPQDLRILTQLYYLEKLDPGAPSYDAIARHLFGLNATGHDVLILQIYRDYMRLSLEKSALDTETSLKLVMRFTRMNEVMEADKLMKSLLEKQATHPVLTKAASALADAMERLHEPVKARFYRQVASS
jgi:membrane associated rhomboid family serine protease